MMDEWIIYLSFFIVLPILYFLIYLLLRNEGEKYIEDKIPDEVEKQSSESPLGTFGPGITLYEIFDYKGTRIFNNGGVYTVIDKGVTRFFDSLSQVPPQYRNMIRELDEKRGEGENDHYFLENNNGKYYVRFPDGKKKKYKKYTDIPPDIRKFLSR